MFLNQHPPSKQQPIKKPPQLLLPNPYLTTHYLHKIFQTQHISSTFIRNPIAIPHRTQDPKSPLLHSPISIIQIP
ncbi:PTS sugar transporter subunit IIA, partial [Bacillus altitudinis]|uniref:PTS sugar transporter subunit IIA n=1 Tax=Bacillus altitudinis TaxID=293387 RepID=UPI003B52E824